MDFGSCPVNPDLMSAYRKMLSRTQSVIIFATLTVVGCSESNEAMPRSQVTGVEAADLPNTAPAEIATPPGIGVSRDKVVRLFKDLSLIHISEPTRPY